MMPHTNRVSWQSPSTRMVCKYLLVNTKDADPCQETKMPWDSMPIFESLPVFSTELASRRNGAHISTALKETTRSLIR